MKVYIDLDGVLANFGATASKLTPNGDWRSEVEKPSWGCLSQTQDLYRILEPMPDSYLLWKYLRHEFDRVEILTAIPRRVHFPNAVNHKREWVWKYFGGHVKVNFGPYAYDKQFHCEPGDILIDDSEINCNQWKLRAGKAIQHISAVDTIEQISRLYINSKY